MKKQRFKARITDEMYKKMQARNPLWTREAYDKSEEMSEQFRENIIYLCKKKGILIKDMIKWLNEMGITFRTSRLYEWGRDHAVYPSVVEIVFFSKYLGEDPGLMLTKDFRVSDSLSGSGA